MSGNHFGTSFFLGANNKAGYCSLFSEVYSPFEEGHRYILKGGPGTGKSTFMKKAANLLEKRGLFLERCYCSADPTSLDAVIAPEIGFSIFDGTAPHTFDPTLPGVTEHIINLGEALDSGYLGRFREKIGALTEKISLEHKKASEYLYYAARFHADAASTVREEADIKKLSLFLNRLSKRALPVSSRGTPSVKKRFLSAVTPEGVCVMYDTLNELCDVIITLSDRFGALSPTAMSFLSLEAQKKGYTVYECYCPLFPYCAPEHIIVPQLGLCFFSENRYHHSLSDGENTINASRFYNTEHLLLNKEKLTFLEKCKAELIDEAVKNMSIAKDLHDELEQYYIKAADFEKIDAMCEKLLKTI